MRDGAARCGRRAGDAIAGGRCDPRIPDERSRWTVWYRDTFDREAPPWREREGIGIVAGLRVLWHKTIDEGVTDEGRASFSRFSLSWGDQTVGESAWIRVDVTHNEGLVKIKRWCDDALVDAIARVHLVRLERSDRWNKPTILPCIEADAILEAAVASTDAAQLRTRLSRLAAIA